MKILGIENLEPGMVLARTVNSFSCQNLLTEGTLLNEEFIQRLKDLGISSVYIADENLAEVEIDDLVCEQTRLEASQLAKDLVNRTRLGKGLNAKHIREMTCTIIDELLEKKELLIKLIDIRTNSDYIYFHSVNVAIMSGVVGIKLAFTNHQLLELMEGALLHDIGKVRAGDQQASIRQHPQLGYEILKEVKGFSILSANVALQHHERVDGEGYPRALTGEEIHQYGKIVAIANTYDMLTTDNQNKPRIPPHQAIEFLMVNSGYAFDSDLVNTFIQCIALYPEGTIVKLNTGEIAVIVKSYYGFPTRPRIKILIDKAGNKLPMPETLELYKSPTCFITDVLDSLMA